MSMQPHEYQKIERMVRRWEKSMVGFRKNYQVGLAMPFSMLEDKEIQREKRQKIENDFIEKISTASELIKDLKAASAVKNPARRAHYAEEQEAIVKDREMLRRVLNEKIERSIDDTAI